MAFAFCFLLPSLTFVAFVPSQRLCYLTVMLMTLVDNVFVTLLATSPSKSPRNTHSSSVVAFPAHQPSPHCKSQIVHASSLWNQLPDSFRQPSQSCLDSPLHPPVNPSFSSLPLSSSITPSLFHSRLKTYLFDKSFPP